jgi:hypothetical protein
MVARLLIGRKDPSGFPRRKPTMPDPQEGRFSQHAKNVNIVVQTIALVIASAWGVFTFHYIQIKVPKSAPINITLDLQLKRVGAGSGNHPLVAIEMRVSATNPSPRKVYLLPSAFIVRGLKMIPPVPGDTFEMRGVALLNAPQGTFFSRAETMAEKYSKSESSSVVAVGRPFPDNVLNPDEVTTHTLVLHVPAHEYDEIEATIWIPNTTEQGGAVIAWSLDQNLELRPELYRVTSSGERHPMEKDELGIYSADDLGLQFVNSVTQLSLWDASSP